MQLTEIQPFIDYYRKIRQRTLRVACRIPTDRIEWTCRTGNFTLGDILRHLGAIERYMFAENVQLKPSRYPGHGRELADGYEAVFSFLERTHSETLSILSKLSPGDLQKHCATPGGIEITVWKWLRAMVEHEVHHRGQLYLYLSLLGVETPPLYGLTSEEVLERSHPQAQG